MNTDKKNIPDEIFEYMQQAPFIALPAVAQKKVLQYFSAEEYDLLYNTTLDLRKLNDHSSSKERLLKQFDQKYGNRQKLNLDFNNVWKVAAAVLLCGVLMMQFLLIRRSRETPVVASGAKDTVYIVKNMVADTLRIYDTIFKSTGNKAVLYNAVAANQGSVEGNLQTASVRINELPGLNIVRVDDLESALNKRRKNSIKDDTLVKQISFMRL